MLHYEPITVSGARWNEFYRKDIFLSLFNFEYDFADSKHSFDNETKFLVNIFYSCDDLFTTPV